MTKELVNLLDNCNWFRLWFYRTLIYGSSYFYSKSCISNFCFLAVKFLLMFSRINIWFHYQWSRHNKANVFIEWLTCANEIYYKLLPRKFLTGSFLICTKNCFRLNDILTIFAHEIILIRILFWKTTSPLAVTPICNSLLDES